MNQEKPANPTGTAKPNEQFNFDDMGYDYMTQLNADMENEKIKAEQRELRKEAFVRRYILEKKWYKDELEKAEIERKREEELMKERMQ